MRSVSAGFFHIGGRCCVVWFGVGVFRERDEIVEHVS